MDALDRVENSELCPDGKCNCKYDPTCQDIREVCRELRAARLAVMNEGINEDQPYYNGWRHAMFAVRKAMKESK